MDPAAPGSKVSDTEALDDYEEALLSENNKENNGDDYGSDDEIADIEVQNAIEISKSVYTDKSKVVMEKKGRLVKVCNLHEKVENP